MVFEFELELHLMLVWGHFFELDWLLVQLADDAAVGWCSHCYRFSTSQKNSQPNGAISLLTSKGGSASYIYSIDTEKVATNLGARTYSYVHTKCIKNIETTPTTTSYVHSK